MGESFKESCDRWLSGVEPAVSPASYRKYDGVIKAHLLPAFGSWEVTEVTQEEIQRFIGDKKEAELSVASRQTILYVLKKVLEGGTGQPVTIRMKWDLGNDLPADGMQALSPMDEDRLMRSLRREESPDGLAVVLSLRMGLQQGEICALSRREVDLVGRKIRVEGTVVRMMSDSEGRKTQLALTAVTKERRRVVPIPDSVLEQLNRFRVDEGSGYLLTDTEKLPDPRTLQNHFRRMQQGLGLTAYPFAALRHTFGLNCARQGMNAALIGKLMGISEKTAAQYVLKCRNGEEEQLRKFMKG